MHRRKYLATISATVSGLALAGCSADDGSSGDGSGDGTPTASPTPTPTPNPASQLDAEGFFTGNEQTGEWVVEIEASNPTEQSVTAEFSASFTIAEGRGELTAESSEETIPSGESKRFRVPLADPTNLEWGKLTGLAFYGGLLQILINGEPQPNACPDTDLSNPTSEGCEYVYGFQPTHVEVEYGGNWQGAVSAGGNSRTVSRSSITYGAPQGEDTSYIGVSSDANIVSANAQKQDSGGGTLTIRIVNRREVVAEQSTSAEYGVAQVSTTL